MTESVAVTELVPSTGHRVVAPGRRSRGTEIVLAVIAAFILFVAVIGPLLPLPNPNKQVLTNRLLPPIGWGGAQWKHPLGTDQHGRDMLSRLVAGTRLTVVIAIVSVLLGAVVGSMLGVVAGFRRRATDAVISRLTDAQLALPFILLAIAIVTSRGRSISTIILVLAIVGWAQYVRVVRAETLIVRERPFIKSLRIGGMSDTRIILRHVVPNVSGTVLTLSTLEVGTMILAESAMSFLGLGVVTPDISWGALLATGRETMRDAWWPVALPGLAIVLMVLYVNIAGDVLRARYDVRKRMHR
ncbi:ABC transporter permease [Desertimonas flava]|uniref:ABC transporter permease n=1 Tax=Desertimonas flava TaxID=2064846 RepID=UPI000E3555CA|nr:ABC transporter permease [Desertimonas flava]